MIDKTEFDAFMAGQKDQLLREAVIVLHEIINRCVNINANVENGIMKIEITVGEPKLPVKKYTEDKSNG
jgi:hypothetical protein